MNAIKALAFTLLFVGVIPKVIFGLGFSAAVSPERIILGAALWTLMWCALLLDSIDRQMRSRVLAEAQPATRFPSDERG